ARVGPVLLVEGLVLPDGVPGRALAGAKRREGVEEVERPGPRQVRTSSFGIRRDLRALGHRVFHETRDRIGRTGLTIWVGDDLDVVVQNRADDLEGLRAREACLLLALSSLD